MFRPRLRQLNITLIVLVALAVPVLTFGQSSTIASILWTVVNGFFGTLVGIAGVFLDFTIQEFVVDFGDNYINGGIGAQVDILWVTVRDIFNITFIFGLVYIGFMMILDSGNSQTRRWLINLIIAALLVNFSLFFTKFLIDLSNQLSTQIAAPMLQNGVSATFNQAMGLSSIWDVTANDTMFTTANATGGTFGYIFGALLIFIIATFVFAAGAFMLLIRYVVLHIYMVLSPFMFIGFVFPQLMSVTRKYWTGFLGKVFYAPLYLIMIFFAAQILNNSWQQQSGAGSSLAQAFNTNGGAAASAAIPNTIPPFLLAAGFLLAAVIVSNKLGADGAQTAINVGNNIRGRAQRRLRNAGYATGRFAARNTAGYAAQGASAGAQRLSRSLDRMNANLAQGGKIGRATARTIDRTAGAGLRGVAAGATIAGSETAEQKQKRIQDQQKKFNVTSGEIDRENKFYENRDKIETAQAAINDASTSEADKAAAQLELEQAQNVLAGVVGKMSQEELLRLSEARPGVKGLVERAKGFAGDESSGAPRSGADYLMNDPNIAPFITDSQIKGLRESGAISNTQAKGLGDTRGDGFVAEFETSLGDITATAETLGNSFDALSSKVKKMSDDEVKGLGIKNLSNHLIAANLTEKQLDMLEASGKYDVAAMGSIRQARAKGIKQIAEDGALHVPDGSGGYRKPTVRQDGTGKPLAEQQKAFEDKRRQKLFDQNTTETGPLPIEIFTNPDMVEYITPRALEQRMRDGTVTDAELATINDNLRDYINGTGATPSSAAKQTAVEKTWRKWSKNNNNNFAIQAGFTF